jgi:hypothetical protein
MCCSVEEKTAVKRVFLIQILLWQYQVCSVFFIKRKEKFHEEKKKFLK